MFASQREDTKAVQKLLEFDENVNIQDKNGQTALIIASEKGSAEIIKLLVKSCANLNTQNRHGYTALMIADEKGYSDIVTFLRKSAAQTDLRLMIAIHTRETKTVKRLLELGAEVNFKMKMDKQLLLLQLRTEAQN